MDIRHCIDLNRWQNKKFPEEICTIQNKQEKYVYDSTKIFVCIVFDKRFEDRLELRILQPYIYKEKNNISLYGWVDINTGQCIDNYDRPIHSNNEDEYVIGWKEIPEEK